MNTMKSAYTKFKERGVVPDIYLQIDVKKETEDWTICNLYTGPLCVEMAIRTSDYKELIRKGFFLRDGKTPDSANILNTTEIFIRESDLKTTEF